MAVHVFFAILISSLLFHYERLNAPKLLGCLCGFGGVLLINLSGGGLGGGFTLLGDGAVLLAALANGFSISLFKRYAEGEDTLTLCGYQFIVGGGLCCCWVCVSAAHCRISPARPSFCWHTWYCCQPWLRPSGVP